MRTIIIQITWVGADDYLSYFFCWRNKTITTFLPIFYKYEYSNRIYDRRKTNNHCLRSKCIKYIFNQEQTWKKYHKESLACIYLHTQQQLSIDSKRRLRHHFVFILPCLSLFSFQKKMRNGEENVLCIFKVSVMQLWTTNGNERLLRRWWGRFSFE